MTTLPLFAHQKQSLKILAKNKAVFDMSEPGTGKTRVHIEDFATRRRKGAPPAIITATRSLLETAWADDFHTFAPDMHVVCAYANNREKAFSVDCDAYILNHDGVNWLKKQPKKFWKRFEGGTLINDESTAFKHHTAARSKALASLTHYFEYRRNMSGLPDPNGVLDLWHQVYLLDDGKRLGDSYFKFRSAACNAVAKSDPIFKMVTNKDGTKELKKITPCDWVDREGIDLVVAQLLSDISINHKFEECVDIPPNYKYARYTNLNKVLGRQYSDMEAFQISKLKSGKTITAVNKAVVRIKLLQIASGAVYGDRDDEGEGSYHLLDTDRYEFVLDMVEEVRHSIVFFQWKHQRDELIKEAERRGVTYAVYDGTTSDKVRTQITHDYQDGKYHVIFAHPKSAAHGLTWTKGTRTIWASPTDNLEWYVQGLKRIYRIGQTEKTETITVVAKGTYDEIAWERLDGKKIRSDSFANEIRSLLR